MTKEEKLKQLIINLLDNGADPNDIVQEVKGIIEQHSKWALFGDGLWREDTVCSICGLWVAGICGHQDDPNQQIIPRSAYREEVKDD